MAAAAGSVAMEVPGKILEAVDGAAVALQSMPAWKEVTGVPALAVVVRVNV
jgi:hypothetical protein